MFPVAVDAGFFHKKLKIWIAVLPRSMFFLNLYLDSHISESVGCGLLVQMFHRTKDLLAQKMRGVEMVRSNLSLTGSESVRLKRFYYFLPLSFPACEEILSKLHRMESIN